MEQEQPDLKLAEIEEPQASLSEEESAARRHDPEHQLQLCTRAVMKKALRSWAFSNFSHAVGELECLARGEHSTKTLSNSRIYRFTLENVSTNPKVRALVASLEKYMHGNHPEKARIEKIGAALDAQSERSAA